MLNIRYCHWLLFVALLITSALSTQGRAQVTTTQVTTAAEKTIAAFRADLAAKARAADKNHDSVVVGKDGWMFFAPELRSVSAGKFWGAEAKKVSRAVQPEYSDPLPAILDFKAQLDKIGVKLLLVPVPPKSIIFADKISNKIAPSTEDGVLPRVDSAHQEFYQVLRANGVKVLDLTEPFLRSRETEIFGSESGKLLGHDFIYCKQDTHWSPGGCAAAAYLIKRILDNSQLKTPLKYSSRSKSFAMKGDLWNALPVGMKRPKPESLIASYVGTPDAGKQNVLNPVPISRTSPVLLIGDSHTLIYHAGGDMHAKGAGLPDHLARYLGYPVDLLGVRGSGATPARVSLLRRVRANPSYLKNKKWVVWCFSAREWTESAGWQKVPVVK